MTASTGKKEPSLKKSSSSSQSNIRVVARIRPLAKYEIENGSKQIVSPLPSFGASAPATGPTTEPEVLEVKPPDSEKRWFELDAVFGGNSTQRDVYIKSGAQNAVCEDIFRGFNCTILAYGQTGAGKTFSMGTAAGSLEVQETDGIIPRATADLFKMIQGKCDGNAQVELSYLEIYNEEIRDLMVDNNDNSALRIRENLNGEVYVSGLESRPVSSPQEIGKYMEEASGRRVVASTKMNATSSRSHAICALKIKGVLEDSTKFEAKLTLVDLAGSERIKKTGAQGNRRQEGININKGLFVLGQVVSALAEQRPKYKRKPPYRDSKLTRLLQDSLGGNSRTIMVACVSPADFNLDETVNTLRYATSARNIKNSATRNVIKAISPEEAAKLQRENQLLAAQVKELQETIQKMAQDLTPSIASTETTDSYDSFDDEKQDDEQVSKDKKRIKELEHEVKQLKMTLSKSGSKREITQSLADNAIEVPELKKKVATLEEELEMKQEIEEENEALRLELEEVKADAQSSRVAANKMSRIMEQLKELKGEEIDKKKMEHDHIKVEEAWVSFVCQVLETNKDQMNKLREDFYLVARVVESPDVLVPAKAESKWWQRLQKENPDNKPLEMTVDPEMRQQLLSEHIQFFNEKLLEVESDINTESESLLSIRDSLRQQREHLEVEIGTNEFERDSLDNEDSDLLEQLTALLVGPVKNLGDFK